MYKTKKKDLLINSKDLHTICVWVIGIHLLEEAKGGGLVVGVQHIEEEICGHNLSVPSTI